MAEQEAIPTARDPQIEGDSIIPLLQGLLQAPEADITPDSGTESSGEERSGLIAEVQVALDKLAASLKNDPTEISPERRSSLLQLVAKLQAGLATSGKDRRNSGSSQGRFQRRRNRQNRHTVGVSTEELADARRLIEEISLNELVPKVTLQKQNSESSVNFSPKTPVKNAVPKPFSSSSISNASSSVQTPTENLDFPFGENQEVTFHDAPQVQKKSSPNYASSGSSTRSRQVSQSNSADSIDSVSIKSVHLALKEAAANKILEQTVEDSASEEEEAEVEESTENAAAPEKKQLENAASATLQVNPIYKDAGHEDKVGRFNSKKLKMKRANTIDIPKNLILYDEDDSSDNEEDEAQKRRNNYYALRGPIRVNTPQIKTTVPTLQPKTDSDKKFLAFINKHNDNASNKTSVWNNNNNNNVWGSKFGNIKNTFEQTTPAPRNSARNFWKSADDAVSAGTKTQFGPKISRQSARNLQQMFEDKQKEKGVVTGSLKIQNETYKPTDNQPAAINQFSHAPQSAFKPVQKNVSAPATPEIAKFQIKTDGKESMFLYTPKPIFSPPAASTTKPWASTAAEKGSRVLGLAAAKFEQPPAQQNVLKPRKMSGGIARTFIPQEKPPEPKQMPSYVGEARGNSVRKLSGQYDSLGGPGSTKTEAKPAFRPEFTQVQNYSIRYDQPRAQQQVISPPVQRFPPQSTPYQNYPPQNYPTPRYPQQTPQNYSTSYDNKPKAEIAQNQTQYSAESAVCYRTNPVVAHQPQQFKPAPVEQSEDVQYKSTCVFKPQAIPVQPIEPVVQQPPKLEKQTSTESVHEHLAVSSKVMVGPQSQTAVTVRQKSPMSREGHDMESALRSTLQKVGMFEEATKSKSPSNSFKYKSNNTGGVSPNNSFKYRNTEIKSNLASTESFKYKPSDCPKPTVSPSTFKTKFEEKKETGVVKPIMQQTNKPIAIYNNVTNRPRQSIEVNSRGESVVTSQFQIPVINVKTPNSPAPLSKSDSWHQICRTNQQTPSKPASNRVVARSKSSHSLAVPKLFEAGLSRSEIDTKRKTMEAYLAGTKSPEVKVVKTSVKRIKTSEKISAVTGGISRSRTLPDIVCPEMLDESNIDQAFDDLFKSS